MLAELYGEALDNEEWSTELWSGDQEWSQDDWFQQDWYTDDYNRSSRATQHLNKQGPRLHRHLNKQFKRPKHIRTGSTRFNHQLILVHEW